MVDFDIDEIVKITNSDQSRDLYRIQNKEQDKQGHLPQGSKHLLLIGLINRGSYSLWQKESVHVSCDHYMYVCTS